MLKPATMMILSTDEAPIVILTAIVIEYQKEYSTLSKNIQEYQDISKWEDGCKSWPHFSFSHEEYQQH